MQGFYDKSLSGKRLRQCYELAPPRVKQYLEAEIEFVVGHLNRNDTVMEPGCGFGRVSARLAKACRRVVGIDTSIDNLELAREVTSSFANCEFLKMDAGQLEFDDDSFDKVACVQNGICVFGIDQLLLLKGLLKIVRPGGQILVSTYSEAFWSERLEWFELQSQANLLGPIDYERSGNGTIVCHDEFQSGILTPEELRLLGNRLKVSVEIFEVDESSLFGIYTVPSN